MAAVWWALSYSYSFSNPALQYGVTDNAAENGLEWKLEDLIPTPGGLIINGVLYRYTVEKNPQDSMKVHVQNEDAINGGYLFRETDDWSNLPGSTINKYVNLPNIGGEYFGKGSIEIEGIGTVKDPNVRYSYILDPCYVPLTDPSCPGYEQSLYNWLLENGLLSSDVDINDPFFDEIVQALLDKEAELEEEEADVEEKNEEEDDEIERLNAGASIEAMGDPAAQAAAMQALTTIPNFENYYAVSIQGGAYEDTVTLQDTELPDNRSALRNLAFDTKHREMIRSQYDN